MSDNNWPDPARPGVPPSEGFWWLLLPLDVEAIRYFNGEIWRIGGQLADPKDFAKYTLIGPALTPAEVDARVAQARRDALKEAAQMASNRAAAWAEDAIGKFLETKWDYESRAEAGEEIASAILARAALGEKE